MQSTSSKAHLLGGNPLVSYYYRSAIQKVNPHYARMYAHGMEGPAWFLSVVAADGCELAMGHKQGQGAYINQTPVIFSSNARNILGNSLVFP